jgi:hypothetical protein
LAFFIDQCFAPCPSDKRDRRLRRRSRRRGRRKETLNNASLYRGIWHGVFNNSKLEASFIP